MKAFRRFLALALLLGFRHFLRLACARMEGVTQIDAETPSRPGADVVFVQFPFKNAGRRNVHILGIETSCGCTDAVPTTSEVAPGATGALQVVFTIRQGVSGLQEKAILVQTDDAKDRTRLVLRVKLQPPRLRPAIEK